MATTIDTTVDDPTAGDSVPPTPVDKAGGPQQLLLAFLGSLVLDHDDRRHIDARIFVDVLGYLNVSHTVVRTTLNRMVRGGLLDRQRSGRTAAFGITDRAEALLRQGRERVVSPTPFTPNEDTWTLLSYSLPESRRDVRHRLRAQLNWAGFGRLRDGLWIAPGSVDVSDIIAGVDGPDARAVAFSGSPTAGLTPAEFATTAWDLEYIESEHRRFIDAWGRPGEKYSNPAAAYTALGSDWLKLLRNDPGLPDRCLPAKWPSAESVRVHDAAVSVLSDEAEALIERMIASYSQRR